MQFVHPLLDQTVQFMSRPSCYVVCTPPTRLDSAVHVQAQLLCSLYTPYQIRQYSSCTGLVVMQFVHPLLDWTVQFMYRPSYYVVCTPPIRLDSTVHVQAQLLCSLYTPDQIRQYSLCTGLVVMQFVLPLLDQTVQFMYRPSCYFIVHPLLDQTVQFMSRPSCNVVCTPPTRLDSTVSCPGLVVMQFIHPLLDQTVQFMYRSSCYVVCTPPTRLDSTVHVQAQLLCSLYKPLLDQTVQFMYRSSRCVSCVSLSL